MNTIGCIPASTEQQSPEGLSLDNQEARIEQYCIYHSFSLTAVIAEAGISGGNNRTRPVFTELLERIEAGEADVVILYSLKWLSRDIRTLLALERLIHEKAIELQTLKGQVDTSSPDGWLNFAVYSMRGEDLLGRDGRVVGKVPDEQGHVTQGDSGGDCRFRAARLYKRRRQQTQREPPNPSQMNLPRTLPASVTLQGRIDGE